MTWSTGGTSKRCTVRRSRSPVVVGWVLVLLPIFLELALRVLSILRTPVRTCAVEMRDPSFMEAGANTLGLLDRQKAARNSERKSHALR